jgi:hypothetical protein
LDKQTRDKIIDNIIVTSTLRGALTRNHIYKKSANEYDKQQFRYFLGKQLALVLNRILGKKFYSEDDHFKTIETFSNNISNNNKFRKYLLKNELRVGTSQKLINLYWKMAWILKPGIKTPIHCPFDGIIIKELNSSVRNIRWTQLNDIKEYVKLVLAANEIKGRKSIAEWELKTYGNKTIPD